MEKIVLTGFMGTGKTQVGRCLARRLEVPFYDLDTAIEFRAGRPIARIFVEDGEAAFRDLEAEVAGATRHLRDCVVATGGGAVLRPENLSAFREGGVVVGLTATVEAILARVGETGERPLLAEGDRGTRVEALLAAREPAYAQADLRVDTTARTAEEAAAAIVERLAGQLADHGNGRRAGLVEVPLAGRAYRIHAAPGLLAKAGELVGALGLGPRLALVTDDGVPSAHVARALEGLRAGGLRLEPIVVPAGEATKSVPQVAALYDRFVAAGLDRASAVVALGGGVVGDLAGFAAATYLRGIALVQCPTTLLAQVDSSVGGKVAINLPQGKNLVGAFYQPRIVLADTSVLATLAVREFRSGLAEVVKTAAIADPGLFELLEREAGRLAPDAADLLAGIVMRCCRIKAQVVTLDERELGLRAVLNFGHTLGHALEAAAGYGRLAHGEAVAIGMVAAARLSRNRGLCRDADVARLARLLARLGLPVRSPLPGDRVLPYLAQDKKGRRGVPRFVLTGGIADVTLAAVDDLEEVRKALEAID